MTIPTSILAQFPELGGKPSIKAIASGFSGASLWRVGTSQGDYCLRQWPPQTSPARVHELHGLLAAIAARSDLPLALPLASSNGSSWLEHERRIWELTQWLPGEPIGERPVDPRVIESALIGLARFHAAARQLTDRVSDTSEGLAHRQRRLANWNEAIVDRARYAANRLAHGPLARRAASTLQAYREWSPIVSADLARIPRGPLHWVLRDVWRANLLFEGPRLTGLVDYDAMRIDSPACDVARLLGSMAIQSEDWTRGLAAYGQVRSLAPHDTLLIRIAHRSGLLLSALSWFEWFVLEGRDIANRERALARWDELNRDLERSPTDFSWIGS